MLRRNVLIFHQGALGDFVVTWPLAMAMGRIFPQSRIIYVSGGNKGKLAERAIRVESTDVEAGWHQLFSETPRLPEPATKMLRSAHTVFSFGTLPGDRWSRNADAIAPDLAIWNLSTRMNPREGHVSQWLIDDLADFPAGAEAVRQMLRSIAARGLGTHRPTGKLALIHPGSGSDRKNWPAERFLELADKLSSRYDVRFVLGEVELEKSAGRFGNAVTPATYTELYDLLTTASVFIGNDSGPGHIAGIIGVPTITLFGGDPTTWKPLGPKVKVIAKPQIADITVEDVIQEI
jgi:ADP-heptose:LPS heptosyltransferase